MIVGPGEGSVRRPRTKNRRPAKTRRGSTTKDKPNNAPAEARPANSTLADLQQQVSALTRELAEAREQQSATSKVLHAISSSLGDLKPVLAAICEIVAKLCRTKDAEIFIRDGDCLRLGYVQGPIGTEAENWPITRGLVMGRAVLTRKLIQVEDLRAAGEEYPEGYKSSVLVGHRTIIAVPLMRKGEAVGVLTLRFSDVKPFTDKQITLLRTFADQAVIAIENTRLFEAEQQRTHELSESLEQQTATSEVLRVIARSPTDAQPAFEAMVARAARLCEADFSAVARFENGLLHNVAVRWSHPAFAELLMRTPIHPNPKTNVGR